MSRLLPVVLTAAGLAAGCHDPHFEAAQATRDARIRHRLDHLDEIEQARPARLEAIAEFDKELRIRRVEHLEKTLARSKEGHSRRKRDWVEQAPVRHERIRTIFEGKPANIPDTYRKMVY